MRWFFLAAVWAMSACGETSEPRGREPWAVSNVQVSIEPGDLMTSVRGTAIRAVLGHTTPEVSEDVLKSLEGRFTLISESGQSISLKSEVQVEPVAGGSALYLIPASELASEWYDLIVDLRVTRVDPYPQLLSMADGRFKSRFHPDAVPVVQEVRYCRRTDEHQEALLILSFSERVNFVPSRANLLAGSPVAVSIDDAACIMYEVEDQLAVAEGYTSAYQFACSKESSPKSLTISLDRELSSPSGDVASLTVAGEGRVMTLDFSESYGLGDCIYWHLP